MKRKKIKRKENEEKSIFSLLLFECRENEREEKFILYKMTYLSLTNTNIYLNRIIYIIYNKI